MNLLTDFFIVDSVKIISESKDPNAPVKIRGVFGRADEFNNNNRRYKKSILEREIGRLNPLLNERRLLGELDHPEYTSVKLTNASHVITGLKWEGNKLIGEAELLNTPSGKVAQQLLRDGVKIGISSRGLGSLEESKEFSGKYEVSDDYRMVTFDLVADPSTRGAFPTTVSENYAIFQKTSKQLEEETQFISKLKKSLKESTKPAKKVETKRNLVVEAAKICTLIEKIEKQVCKQNSKKSK